MQRRAFTLIELLVVIAIIAILAAILFPVFAQAKAAAKTAATISNLKQSALGSVMYSGDYDDMIPPPGDFWWVDPGIPAWSAVIYPYTKNIDIMFDPALGVPGDMQKLIPGSASDQDVWDDWGWGTGIGCNFLGYNSYRDPSNSYRMGYRTTTAISAPAERAAYAAVQYEGPWGLWHFNSEYAWGVTQDETAALDVNDGWGFWAGLLLRNSRSHSKKNIIGYADGHAGSIPYNKFCYPRSFYKDQAVLNFWGNPYAGN